jgi:translation elongation factor EF-G
VLVQETGEHVIVTAGELHLERCVRDLHDRFAPGVELKVSPPIVAFRESLAEYGTATIAPAAAAAGSSSSSSSAAASPAASVSQTASAGAGSASSSASSSSSSSLAVDVGSDEPRGAVVVTTPNKLVRHVFSDADNSCADICDL